MKHKAHCSAKTADATRAGRADCSLFLNHNYYYWYFPPIIIPHCCCWYCFRTTDALDSHTEPGSGPFLERRHARFLVTLSARISGSGAVGNPGPSRPSAACLERAKARRADGFRWAASLPVGASGKCCSALKLAQGLVRAGRSRFPLVPTRTIIRSLFGWKAGGCWLLLTMKVFLTPSPLML